MQAWVHDILVDHFKERAVEPLKSFIARGAFVSRAILTLKELVSEEELTEFLRETLRRYDPKDHRTVTARENLVDALKASSKKRGFDNEQTPFSMSSFMCRPVGERLVH